MPVDLRAQLQTSLGDAYRLEHELGGGGMSRVFVAEELRLGRKVVVKVLSPDLALGLSAERFEREIRTVAGLQQANIVPVLAAGDTNGLPFYTMPFVEGESLRAHLGGGPLPIADVVGIVKDVAKALGYAHQRGVVHRDIKPDNVLLSGGTAVVTDFGIAKAISAARTSAPGATLTQVGTSIGTPAYMAPEQAAGDANIDHRADLYALGAMTYELLAGHPVFPDRTAQRMLAAHMSEGPRPIGELRADVPATLANLVMRCLAKDPDARPQTASEVVRELDTVASGSSVPAMPAVLLGGRGMFRKALAIYAAAFVVVAVIAKAAIVGIGLPEWVFAGSLVVMALGLPVVLWTGYVQRVTRRAILATPTYTPGGTPTANHGAVATMALKAAPHMSWYRTARGGMYAFAAFIAFIALFMGMRASGIGPFGSLFAAGRLNARDPLLITDFRTTNVDSTLGRVVSDAVRAGLSGSAAITIVPPAAIASALVRSKRAPDTRIDLPIAQDLAQREGIKAIVDGDVTGVGSGYIVSVRLVRADSGSELASFRETGEGPKGLIEAADRLARAIRGKAGESLRLVNATPPLTQATTASLEALRKYSAAVRANAIGDDRATGLAREAVAIDSTFASAWSALAANLSNYGGSQSAIDSALIQAYRYRDRLPALERDALTARYFIMGPGRDRAKGIAAYESILQRGETTSAVLVNLGEALRTRREFARAESLNVAATRLMSRNGTAYGNAIEMQINQGKLKDAAALVEKLYDVSQGYAVNLRMRLAHASGDDSTVRRIADSLVKAGGDARRRSGLFVARSLALLDGRLHAATALRGEQRAANPGRASADQDLEDAYIDVAVMGATPALAARVDSVVDHIPFRDLPMIDRPYLFAAGMLARVGKPEKARAMLGRYRSEMTDTSIVRVQSDGFHNVAGEIALASGKPREALDEFRRGDIGFDGAPADECAACLPFNLARAYDAAGKPDSAAMMFERYLSTPTWFKSSPGLDPVRLPAIRERLGQLYEEMGNTVKAIENYRAFIELWKNADPELQPRVADAKRRLARLAQPEQPRR
ncbi:MAG: protein kinase [Geminicoccaceae bacterium]|nr:protein kinase [Geminicoccaceae bacterium]